MLYLVQSMLKNKKWPVARQPGDVNSFDRLVVSEFTGMPSTLTARRVRVFKAGLRDCLEIYDHLAWR